MVSFAYGLMWNCCIWVYTVLQCSTSKDREDADLLALASCSFPLFYNRWPWLIVNTLQATFIHSHVHICTALSRCFHSNTGTLKHVGKCWRKSSIISALLSSCGSQIHPECFVISASKMSIFCTFFSFLAITKNIIHASLKSRIDG